MLKHFALYIGIVLLAVGGRDLHALDDQFEHVEHAVLGVQLASGQPFGDAVTNVADGARLNELGKILLVISNSSQSGSRCAHHVGGLVFGQFKPTRPPVFSRMRSL